MTTHEPRLGDDRALYRRAVGFLHRARSLHGIPPEAFTRIEEHLARPRVVRRRPLLVAATAFVVLLVAGTAFAVAGGGWARLPIVGTLFVPKVVPDAAPTQRRALRSGTRTGADVHAPSPFGADHVMVVPTESPRPPSPTEAEPAPRPNAAVSAVTPGRDGRAPSRIEPARSAPIQPPLIPAVPEPAADSPLHDESRSFADALAHWHRGRDAGLALVALDAHDRRFPAGHLRIEARLLRAEILLSLGHEREGLALLDQVPLSGSPRSRELFTVRGELRIKLGRCADGRADLDQVLSRGGADAFTRRAVQALSHCP